MFTGLLATCNSLCSSLPPCLSSGSSRPVNLGDFQSERLDWLRKTPRRQSFIFDASKLKHVVWNNRASSDPPYDTPWLVMLGHVVCTFQLFTFWLQGTEWNPNKGYIGAGPQHFETFFSIQWYPFLYFIEYTYLRYPKEQDRKTTKANMHLKTLLPVAFASLIAAQNISIAQAQNTSSVAQNISTTAQAQNTSTTAQAQNISTTAQAQNISTAQAQNISLAQNVSLAQALASQNGTLSTLNCLSILEWFCLLELLIYLQKHYWPRNPNSSIPYQPRKILHLLRHPIPPSRTSLRSQRTRLLQIIRTHFHKCCSTMCWVGHILQVLLPALRSLSQLCCKEVLPMRPRLRP